MQAYPGQRQHKDSQGADYGGVSAQRGHSAVNEGFRDRPEEHPPPGEPRPQGKHSRLDSNLVILAGNMVWVNSLSEFWD